MYLGVFLLLLSSGQVSAEMKFDALPERRAFPPSVLNSYVPEPRPSQWKEPPRLSLPSDEKLFTTWVTNRTFHLVRVGDDSAHHLRLRAKADKGELVEGFDANAAYIYAESDSEVPVFLGSGQAGRFSNERLVVDGCTFIMDFQEGDFGRFDPLRSGLYVEGYREVVVRNCAFLSLSYPTDPLRKTTSSLYAADCVRVSIENCWFGGRTIGWRGHINLWGCGPSEIRHVEIDGLGQAAGGIWVATGVGEGKIGFPHDRSVDPSRTLYPPGPLRIENCWIHDQKGKENSDGVYVQSVRPFLIRNCRIENWRDDSLIDMGFRDTSRRWKSGFLPNHGGLGIVEHCQFSNGLIKPSVGLAGGIVFRKNVLRNSWFFPYAFDGGSFFVVDNRIDPMARVLVSGRNGQVKGWTPPEGMLAQGGHLYFVSNHVVSVSRPVALFVAGAKPGPVADVIRSCANQYSFSEAPTHWAIEHDGRRWTREEWQSKTGNDDVKSEEAVLTAFLDALPKCIPPSTNPPGLLHSPGLMDSTLRDSLKETLHAFKESISKNLPQK